MVVCLPTNGAVWMGLVLIGQLGWVDMEWRYIVLVYTNISCVLVLLWYYIGLLRSRVG